jgi:Zn finger protein HypA/HybF involved in hydrogenase expression
MLLRMETKAERRRRQIAEGSRRLYRKRKAEGQCTKCGGQRDDERYVRCGKCRASNQRKRQLTAARNRQLTRKRKAKGRCWQCGGELDDEQYTRCGKCLAYNRRVHSIHGADLKKQVFAAYGGYRCACCGETEPLFLCIDHINNDGAEHRRQLGVGRRGGNDTYHWLKKQGFPPGFQVLCHNCNIGKHLNKGVCPHASSSPNRAAP